MAHAPRITFKAGRCELLGKRVTPEPQPGYLYIFLEDELPHFCWRPRNLPSTEPALDLIIPPGDVTFEPLVREEGAEELHSPTNGRIYVLRFASSGERHFFYLQSKSQHKDGDPSWFSERDQHLGQVVNAILQGEDVDDETIASLRARRDTGDDEMDLDEETGGAGQGATGGDPRDEGELSREGGEDGGRASSQANTSALVQDFLRSLQGSRTQQAQQAPQQYTTLPDLFPSTTTTSVLSNASQGEIDRLCTYLPADLFLLASEAAVGRTESDPADLSSQASADVSAVIATLSIDVKRQIIARVLRSAQLQQSLGSLTVALRDGGLPMIGEALQLDVEHGGLIRGGSMPLGGGDAVRGFVEGVRRTVEKKSEDQSKESRDEPMED